MTIAKHNMSWQHTRGAASPRGIRPPAGFGWAPPFSITYDWASGKFVSTLDHDAFAPTGTAIYVDVATGLDTKSGADWANAFKTIGKALTTLAANSSLRRVYVKAGNYFWANRWTSTTFTQDVAFIAVDGLVRSSPVDDLVSWSKTGGYTNVYESTRRQTVKGVSDHAVDTGEGYAKCLVAAESIAAVDATAGTYFDSGSKVYVHTANSRAADADVLVYGNLAGPLFNTLGQTVYIEGFIFEGCGSACVNITKGKRFVFVDCKFLYPWVNNGLDADDLEEVYMIRTEAREALQDGFNYATTLRVYEDSCKASGSGRVSGNTNNGSTSHQGAHVIRINCEYQRCYGPNVADVGEGTSWNLGCLSKNSQDASTPANWYTDGNLWLHKCVSILEDSQYDYIEAGSGAVYIFDCEDEESYSGTVLPYVG